MSDSRRDRARHLLNQAFSLGLSPLVLAYQTERRLLNPMTTRRLIGSYGGLLALVPGFTGDFMRRAFYRQVLRQVHESATISAGTTFSSEDVEIGAGVYIGAHCNLGRCRIGQGALLADRVLVIPGKHTHHFKPSGELDLDQVGDDIPISIGEHAWIGAQSVLLADVGARSTIGAGSVVVKPIPADVVAVGNPARVVKRRGG